MSTVVASPPLQPPDSGFDRVVLRNVPWGVYSCLRDDDANGHIRMSFFKGTLELHPADAHSRRVLEALALCQGIPESRWRRVLREWIEGLSDRE